MAGKPPNTNRTHRRSLQTHGQSATLKNIDAQTDGSGDTQRDAHGNPIWDSASTSETTIELVTRGIPSFDHRVDGIDADIDAIAIVDEGETVRSGEDDDANAATRIDTGGRTYVVRSTWDENNGLTRAYCEEV